MVKIIAVLSLITLTTTLSAQEGNWDAYMAKYEKGPGSTIINMDIKKIAPDKRLPFLFSAGVKFTNCTTDGLPSAPEFDNLNRISDSVVAIIDRLVKNTLVGTFTYQCERRDYFYVPDTTGLRQQVINLLTKRFPAYTPAFNVKLDKKWEAYLDFLYPNEETMEYMKNQKVIMQLQKAGDKLDKPRLVDHWLYFKTENDVNCFIQYANQEHYKIGTKEKVTISGYTYKLQLSRTDKVDLSSISKITLELGRQAKKCNGDYDGWETFVVK
jgi:uncharacterized protein (TIGR01619 family)